MKNYLGVILLAGLIGGCASHSTTSQSMVMKADFSQYSTVGITVIDNTEIDEKIYPEELEKIAVARLSKDKLFSNVIRIETPEAVSTVDLLIQATITRIKQPNAAMTIFMAGGDGAEVDVKFVFLDAKTNETVGSIDITGDSKNMGTSSVGGFGVTGPAAFTEKALENLSDGLAQYIIEHHKNAVKT